MAGSLGFGERGRNRTFNLLIKSRQSRCSRFRLKLPIFSCLPQPKPARKRSQVGIEKKRFSSYGIEAYGTFMAQVNGEDLAKLANPETN